MFFKITSITDHIGSAISIPLNGWGSDNVLDYVNFALRYSALVCTYLQCPFLNFEIFLEASYLFLLGLIYNFEHQLGQKQN